MFISWVQSVAENASSLQGCPNGIHVYAVISVDQGLVSDVMLFPKAWLPHVGKIPDDRRIRCFPTVPDFVAL